MRNVAYAAVVLLAACSYDFASVTGNGGAPGTSANLSASSAESTTADATTGPSTTAADASTTTAPASSSTGIATLGPCLDEDGAPFVESFDDADAESRWMLRQDPGDADAAVSLVGGANGNEVRLELFSARVAQYSAKKKVAFADCWIDVRQTNETSNQIDAFTIGTDPNHRFEVRFLSNAGVAEASEVESKWGNGASMSDMVRHEGLRKRQVRLLSVGDEVKAFVGDDPSSLEEVYSGSRQAWMGMNATFSFFIRRRLETDLGAAGGFDDVNLP